MRAKWSSAEDHPGKILHYGRGVCQPCYHARVKAGTVDELPRARRTRAEVQDAMSPDEAVRHRYNTGELDSFIRARRDRGWPADGTFAQERHGRTKVDRHVTAVEFNAAAGRWEWRCNCGAWGRSLLFDEDWIRRRAALHEATP